MVAKSPFEKVRDRLHKLGIKADKPGFLAEPNFLAEESIDPKFLFNYGRFIAWQPYGTAYLERAERIVRIAAEEVQKGLLAEDEQTRLGKCIHAGMALSQILDLHRVWNFMVRGAATVTFPRGSGYAPFHFTLFGSDDQAGKEYGHKWIYAPPFKVVDITLRHQPYEAGAADLLPNIVLAKELHSAQAEPHDLVDSNILKAAKAEGVTAHEFIERHVPDPWRVFMRDVQPGTIKIGDVTLKYIPAGTGGSDGTLENLASYSDGGEKPYQYYLRKIKPLLDEIDYGLSDKANPRASEAIE
jgi:hypothetical protein